MTITISSANTGQALETFISLPARLYSSFPEYVPPLKMEREGVLHPDKAAFFKHGIAQYWLAWHDGEPVGRISAQIDYSQPEGVYDDAGLFGCLDTIDDAEVASTLIATAESWLRQQGKERAIGPFLLSMNSEPGLLVAGNDEPPLVMVPWHPTYLEKYILASGYARAHDMHYWRLDDLPSRVSELRKRKRPGQRFGDLVVRKFDMKKIPAEIEMMRQIFNDAWRDNWGFVPLEEADIESISKDLKPFIKPEYGIFVEKDGKTIAVAMAVPNLFEITGDVGPDPSPIGWAKLGLRTLFHRFRTGHIVLLGVIEEYRHSIGGAVIAMTIVDEIVERFIDYKDQTGWLEAGWVLEDNDALIRILEGYGFKRKRTLRLFDKPLDAGQDLRS